MQNKSHDKWTETFKSEMNVGGNVVMDAGHDLNLKGGTQLVAAGDILLKADNDINITAAKDTTSHDSRTTGGKFGIDVQGGGITVGGNGGFARGDGDYYTYATVEAGGGLHIISGNDTSASCMARPWTWTWAGT
jgi:filamentous hemagglutinin